VDGAPRTTTDEHALAPLTTLGLEDDGDCDQQLVLAVLARTPAGDEDTTLRLLPLGLCLAWRAQSSRLRGLRSVLQQVM
jgi:hypothetical protein